MIDRLGRVPGLLGALCLFLSSIAGAQPAVEWLPTTDETIQLRFTVRNLREAKRIDGKPVLLYDGGRPPVAPEAESPFPKTVAAIGLPPDARPTVRIAEIQEEILPLELFPSLLASDWELNRPAEPPVIAEAVGYFRDRYVGRVVFRPIRVEGNRIRLIRSCLVVVEPNAPPQAPGSFLRPFPPSALDAVAQTLLVNAPQAQRWRIGRRPVAPAPADPGGQVRIKIRVKKTGLYRITYQDLQRLGFSPETIDVKTLAMSWRDTTVGVDLIGGDDDRFDPGDLLVFYGEQIGHNRFTDTNVYYLYWGGAEQPPLPRRDGTVTDPTAPAPRAFRAPDFYEIDRIHDPLPEVQDEQADHYFWRGFTGGGVRDEKKQMFLQLEFPNEADNIPLPAIGRIAYQGAGSPSNLHRMQFRVGSVILNNASWLGQIAYQARFEFPQMYIGDLTDFFIDCLDENGTPDAPNVFDVYLDWIEIDYWRQMRHRFGGVFLSSNLYPEPQPGPLLYRIQDLPAPEVYVYERDRNGLTARVVGFSVDPQPNGLYTVSFQGDGEKLTEYVVAVRSDLKPPAGLEPAPYSGLRSPSNDANYLIIAHPDFLEAVQKLADYRQRQGYRVLVVSVEDVYNDFSYGLFTPFAIRNFLRYAFNVWSTPPEFVLLVGDAHYDYKNAEERYYREFGINKKNYANFVPTIHSWSPEWGETAMDSRLVMVQGDDPIPDIAIGRLPVQRPGELSEVIDKIIAYEANRESGPWRARIVQVADDDLTNIGDHIFQASRETLIQEVIDPAWEVQRIYLKEIGSSFQTKKMIRGAIQDGALLLQYAGHGGRTIWADENIFHLADVPRTQNGTRQPVIIATTCEMNFFDKPEEMGQRPLGEAFLLGRNRGAVATIGATRLTYALCNAEFDLYLFPRFLDGPDDRLGVMFLGAVTDNMVSAAQNTSCQAGLQQYVLLGDPALRLLRPQYRVPVALNTPAVNPGQELRILQGTIYYAYREGNPPNPLFSGTLTADVWYPNDLDFNPNNDVPRNPKTVPVVGGEFGDIVFSVAPQATAGEGVVRAIAVSPRGVAIGGGRFSVGQSRILEIVHRRDGRKLWITVYLANPQGEQGIRTVEVEWTDTEQFLLTTQELVRREGLVYVTDPPLPLPGLGKRVKYTIRVIDRTGREIASSVREFRMPLGPDLRIAEFGRTQIPEVSYEFDNQRDQWIFRVVVSNRGDERPSQPVLVYAVYGDADQDGDWILDPDAQVLGVATVQPTDWYQDPQRSEEFERAVAILPLEEPLRSGVHPITFWVDPETVDDNHDDPVDGDVDESLELNNRLTRNIEINDFVIGDVDTTAHSLDRTIEIFIPAGATPKTTLSISSELPPARVPFENPDAPLAPVQSFRLVNPDRSAYRLRLQSGATRFDKPIRLSVALDTAALLRDLAVELGLSPFEEEWSAADRTRLRETLAATYPYLGIYRWSETQRLWKRVGGKLLTDADGTPREKTIITDPAPNGAAQRGLRIASLQLDPDLTPLGHWALFFLNANEYEVLLQSSNETTYQRLGTLGKLNEVYSDPTVGLRELLVTADPDLRPILGDTLTFDSVLSNEGRVVPARFRTGNRGNGTVQLTMDPRWDLAQAPVGDWVFFLMGDRYYELRDGHGAPVRNVSGSRAVGQVDGVRLAFSQLGIQTIALSGTTPFAFGDTFRVRIGRVGIVEAEADRPGLYALLRDRDQQPPRVQVWVDKQPVQNGDVIAPRPEISFLITDPNGIDADSLRYDIHQEGKHGFVPPQKDQWQLDLPEYTSARITHRPILFPGTYQLRLRVSDLAGVSVGTPETPYLLFTVRVTEEPDLEPPTFALSADGEPLNDGDLLTETPQQYALLIRDDRGLDIKTLQLSIQAEGEPEPTPLERYDLIFDPTTPTTARVEWPGDLPNGTYTVRAQVADTSTNVGHLGEPPEGGISFSIDEPAVFEGQVLNAPNPFNPLSAETRGTFFIYRLTQAAERVVVRIYTIAGRLVRVLEADQVRRGYNELYWDGRDETGQLLANGVYFYRIRIESVHLGDRLSQEQAGKLVILR